MKKIAAVDKATTADSPWQSLANAIVIVAADDYRRCLRKLSEPYISDEDRAKWVRRRDECVSFFKSEWCKMLTKVSGTKIMDAIRNEVENENQTA